MKKSFFAVALTALFVAAVITAFRTGKVYAQNDASHFTLTANEEAFFETEIAVNAEDGFRIAFDFISFGINAGSTAKDKRNACTDYIVFDFGGAESGFKVKILPFYDDDTYRYNRMQADLISYNRDGDNYVETVETYRYVFRDGHTIEYAERGDFSYILADGVCFVPDGSISVDGDLKLSVTARSSVDGKFSVSAEEGGEVPVWPVAVTGLVTDSPTLVGAGEFMNADFSDGVLYWSMRGNSRVVTENGIDYGYIDGEGSIYQGLTLSTGEYLFKVSAKAIGSGAKMFVSDAVTGEIVAETAIDKDKFNYFTVFTVIAKEGTYRIGIESQTGTKAYFDTAAMTVSPYTVADEMALRSEIYSDMNVLPDEFVYQSSTWKIENDDGNNILRQTSNILLTNATTRYDEYTSVYFNAKLRIDGFAGSDNMVSIILRKTNGTGYVVYFSRARNQICIRKDKNGEAFLANTDFNLGTGIWYDVAITCETAGGKTEIKMYIDGKEFLAGTDNSSIIVSGSVALSCYNASAAFDDVYISGDIDADEKITLSVVDDDGESVDGANMVFYTDGVVTGKYVSENGTVTVPVTGGKMYYNAYKFGYEKIDTTALGNTRKIVLKKTNKIIADDFSTNEYWTDMTSGFSVSGGKLRQTDGSVSIQRASSTASASGDFTSEMKIIYTGGPAQAGHNFSISLYKGNAYVRLEYQPFYGLVALHKLNVREGNDFYASFNDDRLKSVGAEIQVVLFVRNGTLSVRVSIGNEIKLDTGYGIAAEGTSSIQISTYGLEVECDHFLFSAEEETVAVLYDVTGYPVSGKTVTLYDGSKEVSQAVTDENGAAKFGFAFKKGLTVRAAGDVFYGEANAVLGANIASVVVPYSENLFNVSEPGEFTVIFTGADGQEISRQTVFSAGEITVPDTSSVTDFYGWSMDISSLSFDCVVRAVIAEGYYTITFIDGNGNVIGSSSAYRDKPISSVPEVYAANGNHTGWKGADGNKTDIFEIREDTVVTAMVSYGYKVTFIDKNGKKYISCFDEGERIIPPETDEIEGYDAVGYNIGFDKAVRDIIVYVEYEPKDVNVVFLDGDGNKICDAVTKYDSYVLPPEIPVKEGYTFVGFDKSLVGIRGDVVMKAVYERAKYKVVFYDFYGKVISEQDVVAGNGATAPSISGDADHNFKGWDTSFDNITEYTMVRPLLNSDDTVDVTLVNTLTGETRIRYDNGLFRRRVHDNGRRRNRVRHVR